MTTSPEAPVDQPSSWFNKPVGDVVADHATNAESGLSSAEAVSRLVLPNSSDAVRARL